MLITMIAIGALIPMVYPILKGLYEFHKSSSDSGEPKGIIAEYTEDFVPYPHVGVETFPEYVPPKFYDSKEPDYRVSDRFILPDYDNVWAVVSSGEYVITTDELKIIIDVWDLEPTSDNSIYG